MRSVGPEEIQDTIDRKRGWPFEDDAVDISFFSSFSLFASIRSRMNRSRGSFANFIPDLVLPLLLTALPVPESAQRQKRHGIVQLRLLSFVRALLFSERRTFDFVSRVKAKDRISRRLLKISLSSCFSDIRFFTETRYLSNCICPPSNH